MADLEHDAGQVGDTVDKTLRMERADDYFDVHLRKQREWYSAKASSYKKIHQYIGFTLILCGALTSLVQIFSKSEIDYAIPVITAVLGVIVVLAEGAQRIGKFGESWIAYRQTSEAMKQEYRLYINGAGPYRNDRDEESAYLNFVERVEELIAAEQQLHWQNRQEEPPATSAPAPK